MELRQLEYFVAVAEECHFTRAADRFRVAQPAVSQQIRRLEAELGERLFRRDRRSVALTAAGEALLPHARAMLAEAAGAKESISALSGLLTGSLAVGLVQPLPDQRVPALLGAFHRRHPQIRLTLVEEETDALLEELAGGALDVAVIGQGPADPPLPDEMGPRVIARERLDVALHPEHPLAQRESLSLAELRGAPVVTAPHSSKLRTNLERACRESGFTPNVVAETRDLGLVCQLVLQGIGVAVLPESAAAAAPELVRVPLSAPDLQRRIVIAARPRYTSPAGRAFLAMARRRLAEPEAAPPGAGPR
ncbi:LysR family transcriptional regulator [Streptomonospora sp. PA3]|uniref:LysR family transcriptional regulator n=1 Tax=Streptomonospora sp. PA3 TaxID=2607326 RepID=UPI0012DD9F72|nr:LysR substrate-binding domain-containing protein [Streptomonospora sp. PA3]MUL40407.1 LysR family transcriptional regulator [Streptomonospora sp. PA3]